ncbi:MAG: sigma-E factor regulatory protein RseB domain-containing protein [Trebonia sp.]
MRHGLLLTAVATVTVPGLLAMMAVVGHEHVAVETGVSAVALDGAPLSGPFPLAPATARAMVRNNVAGEQLASGTPVTVLSRVTIAQQVMGMHLLTGAATAGLATSYQGTELISQSGVAGSIKMISQVWHQGGGLTLAETSDGTTVSSAARTGASGVASSDPVSVSPEGVFGVTKALVALLSKHYVAVYRGSGATVGRTATVVELYRFDGSLAARYWLDKQTMVPLRRELFDTSDNVISEDSFVQVTFGGPAASRLAAAGTVKAQLLTTAPAAPQPAWVASATPTQFATSLAAQGWRVPGSLPGGLPLYTAAWTQTTSGEVVDLEYSDGLYVVSLFVQRGTLASDMAGWQQVYVGGQQAFVSGHSVTWSGLGFVYTMIADAPPQTMAEVVAALPRSAPPGVLSRLGRGFIRLAHVINPFG